LHNAAGEENDMSGKITSPADVLALNPRPFYIQYQ